MCSFPQNDASSQESTTSWSASQPSQAMLPASRVVAMAPARTSRRSQMKFTLELHFSSIWQCHRQAQLGSQFCYHSVAWTHPGPAKALRRPRPPWRPGWRYLLKLPRCKWNPHWMQMAQLVKSVQHFLAPLDQLTPEEVPSWAH